MNQKQPLENAVISAGSSVMKKIKQKMDKKAFIS